MDCHRMQMWYLVGMQLCKQMQAHDNNYVIIIKQNATTMTPSISHLHIILYAHEGRAACICLHCNSIVTSTVQ